MMIGVQGGATGSSGTCLARWLKAVTGKKVQVESPTYVLHARGLKQEVTLPLHLCDTERHLVAQFNSQAEVCSANS
jgi:tRNA A37 threonylcarbamoyladenosine biosynthesis protein TsaE